MSSAERIVMIFFIGILRVLVELGVQVKRKVSQVNNFDFRKYCFLIIFAREISAVDISTFLRKASHFVNEFSGLTLLLFRAPSGVKRPNFSFQH